MSQFVMEPWAAWTLIGVGAVWFGLFVGTVFRA